MGKKLAVLLIVVLLALPLAACGGGGGAQKPAAPVAQETRAAPTQAPAPAQPKATSPAAPQPSSPAAPQVAGPTQAPAKPQAGQPAQAGPTKLSNVAMPEFLRMKGTATPGTILDILAKGMIFNLEEAFPQMRVRNIPGGTYEGVWRVENGEVDVGITNTTEPYVGWYGGGTYPRQTRNVRTLFQPPYISTGYFVVLESSKIYTWKDMDGKKICPGVAGYSTARTIAPALLKLYGMSYESISAHGGSVLYTTNDVGLQMVGDGKIDVTFCGGVDPYGPLAALAESRRVRILKFTDQELAEVERVSPGFATTVLPAKMYKGQDEPIKVFGYGNPVLVNAGMDPGVAYNLLWGIFKDNGKRFREMHPRLSNEDMVAVGADKTIVPLHPGAETYWKQRGATIGKPLVESVGPPK